MHEHAPSHLNERTDARTWLTIGLVMLLCLAGAIALRPKSVEPAFSPVPPKKAVVTGVEERTASVEFLETGEAAEVEIGSSDFVGPRMRIQDGDRVYVSESISPDGERTYYIAMRDRARMTVWLGLLFIAVVLMVSRGRGLRAIVALAFGFVMVTVFMMPQLAAGRNLIIVSVIGSVLILGPTYLISYGPTRKSALAAFTTIFTMFVALALTELFAAMMGISGIADDDAVNYALNNGKDAIFLAQLFIVGTLIGILGVLDDVIIAQISTVFELAEANPKFGRLELFRRAMRVGNDHIASVVNTLILAYAGASLPLFLFFTQTPQPLGLIVSDEAVATELVRMLAGTVSLVLAVPLSTAIAASFRLKRRI